MGKTLRNRRGKKTSQVWLDKDNQKLKKLVKNKYKYDNHLVIEPDYSSDSHVVEQ